MSLPEAKQINVFIGHDERLDIDWQICSKSLRWNNKEGSRKPIRIFKMNHRDLRQIKLFQRAWQVEGDTGNYLDLKDGRPFSTQFSHSRFLAPSYAKYLGCNALDPCIFVDSDFIFMSDIWDILVDCKDWREKPISVVKHSFMPLATEKMDHQSQVKYPMKLWSSLILFNLLHPSHKPDIDKVNAENGSWLHGFGWLKADQIGEIPEKWNFIPNHSEERVKTRDVKAIHFTEGSPALLGNKIKYSEIYSFYKQMVLEENLERLKEPINGGY